MIKQKSIPVFTPVTNEGIKMKNGVQTMVRTTGALLGGHSKSPSSRNSMVFLTPTRGEKT